MCLQSDPKCYHSHAFNKLAKAIASFLWWKCLEFHGEKPFKILNAYVYALFSYNFSFDPSLWWPLHLCLAPIKGHTRLSAT